MFKLTEFAPLYDISIHALREEGDCGDSLFCKTTDPFLSTPSARRATGASTNVARIGLGFLSTPSARRATCLYKFRQLELEEISIHALREEGDKQLTQSDYREKNFYPRPPRGGRLKEQYPNTLVGFISIHALREEGDYFGLPTGVKNKLFLSTPSARRATRTSAPLGRVDSDFYPRPPRGGRLSDGHKKTKAMGFLSTPSARRATRQEIQQRGSSSNFYPRPPRGGRPTKAT